MLLKWQINHIILYDVSGKMPTNFSFWWSLVWKSRNEVITDLIKQQQEIHIQERAIKKLMKFVVLKFVALSYNNG